MEQELWAQLGSISTNQLILLLTLSAVWSYLLGCFNGAVIVSKYILKDDIRNHGSGNAGMTNFYRTFGGKLTFLVIGLDIVKMIVAVLLTEHVFSLYLSEVPVAIRYFAGVFCTFGHMFPVMFQFRGGKGVLSGGALICMLDWRIAVILLSIFFIAVIITKWISFGSCCAGFMFPFISYYIYSSISVFLLSLIVGGLILWQHSANIKRMIRKEEHKFSFKRK